MPKKTPYDQLPLLPNLVAETVCATPYTGAEWRDGGSLPIAKIEANRLAMTSEDIRAFADSCDERCRKAYDANAKWFLDCVKNDTGRDQLYVWITHWLAAHLNH